MDREFQPVIITASRATDIPAYYGKWLINRMKAGWCEWINPFNRERRTVSFAHTRAFVFWTKNALPFMQYLDEFDRFGVGYYFTYTINDYVREGWEPGVPGLEDRLANFRELSARLGNQRVIWRVDPLILSDTLDVDELLRRIEYTGSVIAPYTRTLVTSFVDIGYYKKVSRNVSKLASGMREPSKSEKRRLLAGISKICSHWGIKPTICSESGSWEDLGFSRASCVDGELLRKLYPQDLALIEYLSPPRARNMFNGEYDSVNSVMKDRGQRRECGCITSKDIGAYDTCPAGCVYCYASSTAQKVAHNIAEHDPAAAGLVR